MVGDSQRHSQREATEQNIFIDGATKMEKQRSLNILGEIKKPVMVENNLIENCKDAKSAVLLCISLSRVRYSNTYLAMLLEIDKGHFSRILSGKAHFPTNKRIDLMMLCGNYAPLQYEAKETGLVLMEPSEKERKIIEAENLLKKLKAS